MDILKNYKKELIDIVGYFDSRENSRVFLSFQQIFRLNRYLHRVGSPVRFGPVTSKEGFEINVERILVRRYLKVVDLDGSTGSRSTLISVFSDLENAVL